MKEESLVSLLALGRYRNQEHINQVKRNCIRAPLFWHLNITGGSGDTWEEMGQAAKHHEVMSGERHQLIWVAVCSSDNPIQRGGPPVLYVGLR